MTSVVIEVEGERVQGWISHLSRRSVEVAIVEPYRGVSTSVCIPLFACAVASFVESDGRINERGREQVEQLLRELFRACRLFERDRDAIAAASARFVADAEAQIVRVDGLTDDGFYAARRALRRDLRVGLDAKVYARRLRDLERRRSDLHFAHRSVLTALADWLDQAHGVRTAGDVVATLARQNGISVPRCEACSPEAAR